VIGAEHGDHPPVLEQRHGDKRGDLPRPQRRTVVIVEPWIRLDVADHDGLAALESVAQRRPHADLQRRSDQRFDPTCVLAANDVLGTIEFRVADAVDAEILAKIRCGSLLDGRGGAQRAERVVQSEKKRQPLFVRAQFGFRPAVLECRPGPIGDILNEVNLVGRPHTWRAAVNAERADETAIFDQQRTDVGSDSRRLQRRALLGGVSFGRRVMDRQRPAFQNVFGAAAAEIAPLQAARQRRHTIHVVVDDDAVVALDLAVGHPVDPQVCAEQATRFLKNALWIGERPEGVVEALQEGLPVLAPAQCLFCAGTLAGAPHPIGRDFNQGDLIGSPGPRRGAVDAEGPKPSTTFDERRANERHSLAGQQLVALRVGESRIGVDVIDHHGLATAAPVDDRLAESCDRAATRRRQAPVGIGPNDHELVAIDIRVVHATGVEMLSEQADGDFLDLDRVLQGAQPLGERDQEMPRDGHGFGGDSSRFSLHAGFSPLRAHRQDHSGQKRPSAPGALTSRWPGA